MPIIDIDGVAGIEMFWDDGDVACRRCVQDDEWLREDRYEVILKSDLDGDNLYYCDRGQHRIK